MTTAVERQYFWQCLIRVISGNMSGNVNGYFFQTLVHWGVVAPRQHRICWFLPVVFVVSCGGCFQRYDVLTLHGQRGLAEISPNVKRKSKVFNTGAGVATCIERFSVVLCTYPKRVAAFLVEDFSISDLSSIFYVGSISWIMSELRNATRRIDLVTDYSGGARKTGCVTCESRAVLSLFQLFLYRPFDVSPRSPPTDVHVHHTGRTPLCTFQIFPTGWFLGHCNSNAELKGTAGWLLNRQFAAFRVYRGVSGEVPDSAPGGVEERMPIGT